MAQVIVDHEKCNKDGICAAECPAQVLRIEKGDGFPEPTPDFDDVCLRCGHCVAVCPTGAFSLDWLRTEACPPVRGRARTCPRTGRTVPPVASVDSGLQARAP